MNLSGIVGGVIGVVNPLVVATIRRSTGYSTGADGKRVPGYADPVPVSCQIQALSYSDLMQLEGLNVQGTRRAIYLNGDWEGIVRADRRGGDLITTPDGKVWLVALVLEHWPDWTKVAATLQDGS